MYAHHLLIIVIAQSLLSIEKPFCSSQQLQCDHLKDLCPGDLITATCSIQSPVVLWLIHTTDSGSYEIDFNARDAVGSKETDGVFSANLTHHYPTPNTISTSVLQYAYTNELNNTNLVCANLLNETLTQSCQIFNNELPRSVKNIRTIENTCQHTLISWGEPETTHHIDHYMVVLEPSTTCTEMNECIVPTPNFNLTNLSYGVNYTISVSACSCDGCGINTLYNFASDSLTKTELIGRLVIVGNINYNVQKKNIGYEIILSWEEPIQSCALFYSVNIQNAGQSPEIFNTTNTSLKIQNRSQGTSFFVSVAGANGGIIGPYSTPAKCIDIKIPDIVTNVNGKISRHQSDANYYLLMDWAPPTNGTCTRPQVTSYVVSLNDVVWSTTTNKTNKQLSTTLFSSEDTTVVVYIHAINSVGPGPTRSISLQLPNKAVSRTLSGVSISFIIAVFACLLGIL